ncbi:diguanylate cyclase (GGDEF) domain-containing protein [Desulfonauticus submarinus]|uniref:diguanylate cyclase n=1 Tax=Desulfonauticus submarinus TaxID=206665 RepID=A0A1H0DZG5_9BACT|nr:GGDEF domain-containing protein [Desulfonauticus submarinus]SDN75509.1 diguanylate cyclase (GGDEF) domain-containing protein [Desulfonauticus submarinus]
MAKIIYKPHAKIYKDWILTKIFIYCFYVAVICFCLIGVYFIEVKNIEFLKYIFIFFVSVMLIFFRPIIKFFMYVLFFNNINKIRKVIKDLKEGTFSVSIKLPPEGEDEDEFVKFLRDINWMIHSIVNEYLKLEKEKKQVEERARFYLRASCTDSLTGLYNKKAFFKLMYNILSQGQTGFLIFLDIDNFKRINDRYGHLVGDDCLQKLAKIILLSIREKVDFACRYGGDEFCIFLKTLKKEVVKKVLKRMFLLFQNEIKLAEISFSCGIVNVEKINLPNSLDLKDYLDDVFKKADVSLYKAKKTKGKIVFYNKSFKK